MVDREPNRIPILLGPILGLAVAAAVGWYGWQGFAARRGELLDLQRREILTTAHAMDYLIRAYLSERGAEAEYMARLYAGGEMRSPEAFARFAKPILDSHEEHRWFAVYIESGHPSGAAPLGLEPSLPAASEVVAEILRDMAAGVTSVGVLMRVGYDPSSGEALLAFLRPVEGVEHRPPCVVYNEVEMTRIPAVITNPFLRERVGYEVRVDGEILMHGGGEQPAMVEDWSHAEITSPLFGRSLGVRIWYLAHHIQEASRRGRGAILPWVLGVIAGAIAFAGVEAARRSQSHAMRALQDARSTAYLSALVEDWKDPLLLIDERMSIRYANRAASEAAGMASGGLAGRPVTSLFREPDRAQAEESIRNAIQGMSATVFMPALPSASGAGRRGGTYIAPAYVAGEALWILTIDIPADRGA